MNHYTKDWPGTILDTDTTRIRYKYIVRNQTESGSAKAKSSWTEEVEGNVIPLAEDGRNISQRYLNDILLHMQTFLEMNYYLY